MCDTVDAQLHSHGLTLICIVTLSPSTHSPRAQKGLLILVMGGGNQNIRPASRAQNLPSGVLGRVWTAPGLLWAAHLPLPRTRLTWRPRWKPAGLVTAWSQEWKGLAPPGRFSGVHQSTYRRQAGTGGRGSGHHRRERGLEEAGCGALAPQSPTSLPQVSTPLQNQILIPCPTPDLLLAFLPPRNMPFKAPSPLNSPTRPHHSPSVDPESATSLKLCGALSLAFPCRL